MPISRVEPSGMTEPPLARPVQRASTRAPALPQTPGPAEDDPKSASAPEAHKPVVNLPDGTGLRFTVDPDTGKTVAAVVDPETGQVLRQVPSAEALELAKRLGKQSGLVLDLKV